jgi:adsorption protein B
MISLSTVWLWLDMLQRELLLFAAVWVAIGACNEWGMDGLWAWLRLTGRVRTARLPQGFAAVPTAGACRCSPWARGACVAWPRCSCRLVGSGGGGGDGPALPVCLARADLRLYVGCHRNDPATLAAVLGSAHDPRLRIVVHDRAGPTTSVASTGSTPRCRRTRRAAACVCAA